MEQPRDEDLAARAATGDREALTGLLERHGPIARARIAGLVPQRYQSLLSPDDVMQAAYAEAFLGISRFVHHGDGSFVAWLTSIARCTLTDAIRMLDADKRGGGRRQIRPSNDDESLNALWGQVAATNSTPSHGAARREGGRMLIEAVESLPPAQKQVVEMYDLQRRPIEEVAAAIGRSEGAIYLLRARAHRRLAEILGSASRFLTKGG